MVNPVPFYSNGQLVPNTYCDRYDPSRRAGQAQVREAYSRHENMLTSCCPWYELRETVSSKMTLPIKDLREYRWQHRTSKRKPETCVVLLPPCIATAVSTHRSQQRPKEPRVSIHTDTHPWGLERFSQTSNPLFEPFLLWDGVADSSSQPSINRLKSSIGSWGETQRASVTDKRRRFSGRLWGMPRLRRRLGWWFGLARPWCDGTPLE